MAKCRRTKIKISQIHKSQLIRNRQSVGEMRGEGKFRKPGHLQLGMIADISYLSPVIKVSALPVSV